MSINLKFPFLFITWKIVFSLTRPKSILTGKELSYIRKEKYRPATTPAPMYVTLWLPPLDSEMGWTGELWSNRVLLIFEN